jgi:methyl-accepting chemotaxis protein
LARQRVKFAVIAFVLIAPLAFVTVRYVREQSRQISSAARERRGVVAVRPLVDLLGALDAARAGAAHGDPSTIPGVLAASARVDGVLVGLHRPPDLRSSWSALKATITTAVRLAPPVGARAVEAWAAAGGATVGLIAEAADRSNLVLDRDRDTHYLQDAVTLRIPTLLDRGGLGADLSAIDAPGQHDAIAAVRGALGDTLTPLAGDVQRAAGATRDAGLGPSSSGPLSAVTGSAGALMAALERVNATGHSPPSDLGAAMRADALALSHALDPHLGHLLSARISRLRNSEHVVEAVAVLAVLALALVLSLIAGWMRAMARRTDGMQEALAAGALASKGLAATSAQLRSASGDTSTAAHDTAARAAKVSAAAARLSGELGSVAAATAELDGGIHEIARRSSDATRIASDAMSARDRADELVLRLRAGPTEMADVIALVAAIATETRLLGLNATLEAVRAGEGGSGFAVIANEVKDLARRMALSAEQLEQSVQTIHSDTGEAVVAIAEITSIIVQINDVQTEIAASVEQRAVAATEIGTGAGAAAAVSDELARDGAEAAGTARHATIAASAADRHAEELVTLAQELLGLLADRPS